MNGHLLEVFRSWQGEGPYAGARQVFVRFSGCHLRCVYCDTPESWERSRNWSLEGDLRPNPVALDDIVPVLRDWCSRERFHSVSFTGGEPVIQPEFLRALALETRALGQRTYLDSSGTLSDRLEMVADAIDIFALDIKLPSTPGVRADWDDIRRCLSIARRGEVFVKLVVLDATPIDEVGRAAELTASVDRAIPVVLQLATPVNDQTRPPDGARVAAFRREVTARGLEAWVMPQLHVIAGWK